MYTEAEASAGTRRARAGVKIINLQRDGGARRSLLLEIIDLNVDLADFHRTRFKVDRHRQWRHCQQDPILEGLDGERSHTSLP